MLSFFPRGVLGEILNLIESVSEDFPSYSLTLKRQSDVHKFFLLFLVKMSLDVSSESSARQRIHMKNQAFLSSTDKVKN